LAASTTTTTTVTTTTTITTTLRENYKEVYKLWRERNPVARINVDAKALLNQKNYILKTQRFMAVEID